MIVTAVKNSKVQLAPFLPSEIKTRTLSAMRTASLTKRVLVQINVDLQTIRIGHTVDCMALPYFERSCRGNVLNIITDANEVLEGIDRLLDALIIPSINLLIENCYQSHYFRKQTPFIFKYIRCIRNTYTCTKGH